MRYTEEELLMAVNRVVQGDKDAFIILYEAYYRMAVSVLRRVLYAVPSEIEGLTNEAFLVVYKSLKNFKRQSKLSTYVYRIILNFAFYQSKKINKMRSIIRPLKKEESIEDVANHYNVEVSLVEKYFLEQAMGTLSKELLEALDLYYFHRHPIKEIAQICKTTEGTVKSRLFQAREKIRAFMPKGAVYAE